MIAADDRHGWLRNREDPKVLAHLEAENAVTEAALEPTRKLREEIFSEIRTRVKETDLSVPVQIDGWLYYSRTTEGMAYAQHCRRRVGAEPETEHVVLDENVEAFGSDYFDVGVFEVSPDHRLLLWGKDNSGAEKFELFVRDLQTDEDTTVGVSDASYGSAWANDNETFFTIRSDETDRPYQVVRHRLGEAETEVVYTEPDGRFFVSVGREIDDSFIQITSSSSVSDEVWLLRASEPGETPFCFEPRRPEIEYSISHHGDRFYILTNDGATNFMVASTPDDATDRSNWVELIPERPDVMLNGLDTFATHLVVYTRAAGMTQIRVIRWGSDIEEILEQSESLYSTWPGVNIDPNAEVLRYGYSSMVTPPEVLTHNFKTGERVVLKKTEVQGQFDPDDYETFRLWAQAGDGTQIPISYVQKKGRRLPGPCVLYAYGAYEVSVDPSFSVARLSLLDRGCAFAIAHVRGGGEMGRRWYLDGKMTKKPNSFGDAIACAKFLIAEQYTTPGQMCIRGGSAGGLLVGAVLNEAPELFGAAVAEVPFVDVLNTMSDPSLPLTETEWDEWGDPVSMADIAQLMATYSPYDNVRPQNYPAVLATAGFSDPRVGYWEPAKWVMALREATSSGKPILLWTELGAGHGGPSGRYSAWAEEARVLAFILDRISATQNVV